jgi:alkanesulfonate monooxygenase SsuD/methylene tetrahydromethanopterin reductase-like flavin-dependent oxidoreductase (luciferase family)
MTSFGLSVPQALCGFDASGTPVEVDLSRWLAVLEAPGVDSLWVLDQPTGKMATPEALSLLSYVAALTSRPRLGVAVLIAAARGPVATAKAVATLDWISQGRIEVGFGLGDARTYGAFGVDRCRGGGSGAILDELLDIVEQLWTGQAVHHVGRTWRLAGEAVNPPPLQQPRPPVWIGGESDAALGRAISRGGRWFGAGRTSVREFAANALRLRKLHAESGSPCELTIGKRVYVAVHDDRASAEEIVRQWFGQFYGHPEWGPPVAVHGTLDDVRTGIDELIAAGADNLLLHPLADDLEQYQRLVTGVINR